MKILFMNWKSYGNEDFLDACKELKEAGEDLEVKLYPFENTDKRTDPAFEQTFASALEREKPDFVFSFNFYPLLSLVCNRVQVKYVSWVYDCPHISLYSYTLIQPCNYVFVFDSDVYETFARQGIQTVYYLPLAANVKRLDEMEVTGEIWRKYQSRVSFVGQLYHESHTFYDRMEKKLDAYTRGYLEGLMQSQKKVDGINFIEECLTPEIEAGMQRAMPLIPNADGVETSTYMYAQYVINRKITQMERSEIIREIAEKVPLTLYTPDTSFSAPDVTLRPSVDYYTQTPYVYKCTDINLNLTLRSIKKGIPLRILDIMGAGGFVLTNYQEDLLSFFTPGEDFVYYEDRQDLMDKIVYYLAHEEERRAIAKSGHDKVKENHTYLLRLKEIIHTVINSKRQSDI